MQSSTISMRHLPIRKQARAQPIADDPLFQPEPEKDGASILSANQRHQRVRDALEGLSEDQRKVIEASFFLGLSHGKVAEVLEIPLGTVKSRIRLAFTALRKALGEDMQEEWKTTVDHRCTRCILAARAGAVNDSVRINDVFPITFRKQIYCNKDGFCSFLPLPAC